jgi:hypothetical protein
LAFVAALKSSFDRKEKKLEAGGLREPAEPSSEVAPSEYEAIVNY